MCFTCSAGAKHSRKVDIIFFQLKLLMKVLRKRQLLLLQFLPFLWKSLSLLFQFACLFLLLLSFLLLFVSELLLIL